MAAAAAAGAQGFRRYWCILGILLLSMGPCVSGQSVAPWREVCVLMGDKHVECSGNVVPPAGQPFLALEAAEAWCGIRSDDNGISCWPLAGRPAPPAPPAGSFTSLDMMWLTNLALARNGML